MGLSDRTLISPPILHDIVSNLQSRYFDPTVSHCVVIGLCPAGLAELKRTPIDTMRRAIAAQTTCPPSTEFRIVKKEELKLWQ